MRGNLLPLCVFLYAIFICHAQKPSLFGSQTPNELSPLSYMVDKTVVKHDIGSQHGDVNADSIIGPIMQPLARMFNYVANSRGEEDNSETVQRHKPTSMFDPRSILDAVSNDEPSQTASPSFMEKLFEPFIAPVKREMNKVKNFEQPLSNLLQTLGANANRDAEEVQIGRDRTVSVLGMPVGRRDGLALSPLKGMSYGNQDMFGPIAVNDKYNLQWDFLNKISNVFNPTPNGNFNLGGIMNMFGSRQA